MEPSRRLTLSTDAPGREWDDFLLKTPGGHHIQSSAWAEVKSASGWEPLRAVVRENGAIVAGIQILRRSVGFWSVGYAGGGPVFGTENPAARGLLLDLVKRVARKGRIAYLVFQPAKEDPDFTSRCTEDGFRPSSAELISRATVLLDLSRSEEEILADLRKRHRSRIRHAEREGITVAECGDGDLATAYGLMRERARRRGYNADSSETVQAMWNVLHPRGNMRVTLAGVNGDISATLATVCWGDTIFWKRGGWNGKYGQVGLNEYQHWESIVWAKRHGYRYVDMEGIDYECARALLFGEGASYDITKSPNFFKLGFGGSLIMNPEAREIVFNPILRYAFQVVFPRLRNSRLMRMIISRLRGNS